MDVVDIHSHFFSRPFFAALAAQSPLDDPWGVIAAKTSIELPAEDLEAHLARWIGELDAKGVEHLVTFASLPEEVPAVAEAAARAGGRITPIALVHPKIGGDVAPLLDDSGFGGVLLFPAMHHFRLAEQVELLGALDDRGALVFFHCGMLVVKLRDLLGLPRPYDLAYATPLDVIPAANAFPNVKFVIPHFGAGFFRETLMAGAQCENVYVDTSSSNGWIATQETPGLTLRDVFARTLDVFGPSRILFGTDSNIFPAGWRRDRFEEQSALLDEVGLDAVDKALVFAGNARRLLAAHAVAR